MFKSIVSNLTGLVRHEKMEGRDYLVVPMVMMVEGVLNGSSGALFYPAEEMAKLPQVWNHKPVVVYHPQMNGQSLSACDPDMITAHKVGVIMNTSFDGKRLVAEAWLEESRIQEVDPRVMAALNSGTIMEVSTGLFTETEDIQGVFNGVSYQGIARNYRPDHLALLPDQIGACSIADGAGLLRINVQNRAGMELALARFCVNEVSHDAVRAAIYDALKNDASWLEDVYDDHFIYTTGEPSGPLYLQKYHMEDMVAKLDGVKVEVKKKTDYVDLSGKPVTSNVKENMMEREKMIDTLIKNGQFEEGDREFLKGLPDAQLQKVHNMARVNEPVAITPVEPVPDETPAAPVATANNAVSLQEFIANAPVELQDVLRDSLTTHAARRKGLMETIMANAQNVFTVEQLNEMKMNQLEAVAKLAAKPVNNDANGVFNFLGLGHGGVTNTSGVGEVLVAPTMNFGRKQD